MQEKSTESPLPYYQNLPARLYVRDQISSKLKPSACLLVKHGIKMRWAAGAIIKTKTQRKEFMNQTIYKDVSHDPFSSFNVGINKKKSTILLVSVFTTFPIETSLTTFG